MKNKTTSIFLFSLLFIGLFLVVNNVWAAPSNICFKPNVPIPGMSAIFGQDSSTACPDGGYLITPDSIGLYVNALYTYAARLAVAIAMFMIVFASWQWMMAAGNASKIDNAKETIQGALIGLALLFAGQLLLNNISERLVSFKGLDLPPISAVETNICSAAMASHPNYSCGMEIPAGDITCIFNKPCGDKKCVQYRELEVDGQTFITSADCPARKDELKTGEGWRDHCECEPTITITIPPSP